MSNCFRDSVSLAWRWYDEAFPFNILLYVCFFWLLEPLFYLRTLRFRRLRTAQRVPHSADDTAAVLEFWARMITEENDIEAILRGWFLGDGELGKTSLARRHC